MLFVIHVSERFLADFAELIRNNFQMMISMTQIHRFQNNSAKFALEQIARHHMITLFQLFVEFVRIVPISAFVGGGLGFLVLFPLSELFFSKNYLFNLLIPYMFIDHFPCWKHFRAEESLEVYVLSCVLQSW
jgi:hypothetical protein